MALNMAIPNWYRPIEGFVADHHWAIAIVGTVAIVVAVGIRARRERNPNIRGPALTGTARILSSKVSGGGDGAHFSIRVELRVEIPGRQPYDVTVQRTPFDLINLPRVQTGATFPVQVDATDAQKVQIDFSQSITPPQAQSSGLPPAPLGPANPQSVGIDRSPPPPPPVSAGWYPDPNNGQLRRYWDGTRWTENTAPPG